MVSSPDPIDKHVGSRVRMRRIMLGMSQSTLAEGVGLSFQQIQKYEKGTNRLGASRLQQFSNILSVPASFFFEEVPQGPSARETKIDSSISIVADFISSSEGLRLINAFIKIKNPKTKRGIVQLVDQLAVGGEN